MSELYWITRLDGLRMLFIALIMLGIIGTIVFSIVVPIQRYYENDDAIKILTPFYKASIIFLTIGIPGTIFTPTTKEAYME